MEEDGEESGSRKMNAVNAIDCVYVSHISMPTSSSLLIVDCAPQECHITPDFIFHFTSGTVWDFGATEYLMDKMVCRISLDIPTREVGGVMAD